MAASDVSKYLEKIAKYLVNELTPILEIKGVTKNSELLGMYTEASLRMLVKRVVAPMRVCSGAVLDYPEAQFLRQIDLIIWAPFPVPAILDVEGFGLVPRSSAFGVIEVKRSNYSAAERDFERFFEDERETIVADNVAGTTRPKLRGLGVVCVLEQPPSRKLQERINNEQVVAIFEKQGSKVSARPNDVFVLVNFLQQVTQMYRNQSASITVPQVPRRRNATEPKKPKLN